MSTTCDSCGAVIEPVGRELRASGAHRIVIGRRVVEWTSCASCEDADRKRWAEQQRDEERERQEAAERMAKAKERDAERAAKQRSTGNMLTKRGVA